MSWLAVWLVGVGLMDLVRAIDHRDARRAAPLVGVLTVLGLGALSGLAGVADVVLLLVSIVPLLGWWWFSGVGLAVGGRAHVWALLSLALGFLVLVGFSGSAAPVGGPLGRWLAWIQLPLVGGRDAGHVLLVLGGLLVNVATGNLIVRLILVSVGALRPTSAPVVGAQPADRLRGGRLLGPMERIFILGLGLAGQVTAAAVVVAAKGLLRFPELQSKRDPASTGSGVGIDEVTEYFLVGSFVSWLLALGSLALLS